MHENLYLTIENKYNLGKFFRRKAQIILNPIILGGSLPLITGQQEFYDIQSAKSLMKIKARFLTQNNPPSELCCREAPVSCIQQQY
jgi:hypothetical protein